MKIQIITILILFAAVFIAGCKDESNPVDPPVFQGQGFFPNGNGTYYKYQMTETDSAGTETAGTRSTTYMGTQGIYQVQIDSLMAGSETNVSVSMFRKDTTGVYYFIDTTGLSANIPDSLHQYITTQTELYVVKFQFTGGSQWEVFRMALNYGPLTFIPIQVLCFYEGRENITLNLSSGDISREAVKLRYELRVTGDFSGTAVTYSAHSWLVENIGIVKWEGNATVLKGISGGGIDFSDTTKVVSQNLIEYDVKQ